MKSSLRVLLPALTGFLLATLLPALARILLLLARLRTCATLLAALLAALVLLASALILIHVDSSIAGRPAQSNAPDEHLFARLSIQITRGRTFVTPPLLRAG
jgi:hypothetical protein